MKTSYIHVYIDIKAESKTGRFAVYGLVMLVAVRSLGILHSFHGISAYPFVLQTFLMDCPHRLFTGYSRSSDFPSSNSKPFFF